MVAAFPKRQYGSGPEGLHTIIKFIGIFDFEGLLRMIRRWYLDYQYEFKDKTYKSKVPNPLGLEEEIYWEGQKKINWYVQTWIFVDIHTWDCKDVEVIKDGKKTKMMQGRIKIVLDFAIVTDYSNRFDSPFLLDLEKFYQKYIIHHYMDNIYEDQLYYHMFRLQTEIKKFLNMSTAFNASEGRW
jgi:hypothetical protein